MGEPRTINHDPAEPPLDRTGNGIYWLTAAILSLLWLFVLLSGRADWASIGLGLWTGVFVAVWAIDMTGNKTPKWMRR